MTRIQELESKSIYIIREAYAQFRNMAFLLSCGKDSMTLLHIARQAFFGQIPVPIINIDTGYQFPRILEWRDQIVAEWGLDLIVAKNEEALAQGMGPESKQECCTALKTVALQQVLDVYKFDALLLGIRRDEHGIRAKERVFSPRDKNFHWNFMNQPPELWNLYVTHPNKGEHIRIHPMLHWTEFEEWVYIESAGVRIPEMYFARDGKRYRSIGCACCTEPVDSSAVTLHQVIEEVRQSREGERVGRAQDKEDIIRMQTLRAVGYM